MHAVKCVSVVVNVCVRMRGCVCVSVRGCVCVYQGETRAWGKVSDSLIFQIPHDNVIGSLSLGCTN